MNQLVNFFENPPTFAKVIIKHQLAYFFLGHGVFYRLVLKYKSGILILLSLSVCSINGVNNCEKNYVYWVVFMGGSQSV